MSWEGPRVQPLSPHPKEVVLSSDQNASRAPARSGAVGIS